MGIYLLSHVFGRDHIDIAMTKGSNCQNVGSLSAVVQYQVNVSQMRKHEKVCMYIYIYLYIHIRVTFCISGNVCQLSEVKMRAPRYV